MLQGFENHFVGPHSSIFPIQLEEGNCGLRIGIISINNLQYADDTTLTVEKEEDLKTLK